MALRVPIASLFHPNCRLFWNLGNVMQNVINQRSLKNNGTHTGAHLHSQTHTRTFGIGTAKKKVLFHLAAYLTALSTAVWSSVWVNSRIGQDGKHAKNGWNYTFVDTTTPRRLMWSIEEIEHVEKSAMTVANYCCSAAWSQPTRNIASLCKASCHFLSTTPLLVWRTKSRTQLETPSAAFRS